MRKSLCHSLFLCNSRPAAEQEATRQTQDATAGEDPLCQEAAFKGGGRLAFCRWLDPGGAEEVLKRFLMFNNCIFSLSGGSHAGPIRSLVLKVDDSNPSSLCFIHIEPQGTRPEDRAGLSLGGDREGRAEGQTETSGHTEKSTKVCFILVRRLQIC